MDSKEFCEKLGYEVKDDIEDALELKAKIYKDGELIHVIRYIRHFPWGSVVEFVERREIGIELRKFRARLNSKI